MVKNFPPEITGEVLKYLDCSIELNIPWLVRKGTYPAPRLVATNILELAIFYPKEVAPYLPEAFFKAYRVTTVWPNRTGSIWGGDGGGWSDERWPGGWGDDDESDIIGLTNDGMAAGMIADEPAAEPADEPADEPAGDGMAADMAADEPGGDGMAAAMAADDGMNIEDKLYLDCKILSNAPDYISKRIRLYLGVPRLSDRNLALLKPLLEKYSGRFKEIKFFNGIGDSADLLRYAEVCKPCFSLETLTVHSNTRIWEEFSLLNDGSPPDSPPGNLGCLKTVSISMCFFRDFYLSGSLSGVSHLELRPISYHCFRTEVSYKETLSNFCEMLTCMPKLSRLTIGKISIPQHLSRSDKQEWENGKVSSSSLRTLILQNCQSVYPEYRFLKLFEGCCIEFLRIPAALVYSARHFPHVRRLDVYVSPKTSASHLFLSSPRIILENSFFPRRRTKARLSFQTWRC